MQTLMQFNFHIAQSFVNSQEGPDIEFRPAFAIFQTEVRFFNTVDNKGNSNMR